MNYSQPTWSLNGMTCAFADPTSVRTGWSFEALKLVREFQVHWEDLKRQSRHPAVLKLTRKRLETLIEPVEFQFRALEQLLSPLAMTLNEAQLMSYLTEFPGPSRLSANYGNLFRDWVWGEKENEAALQCLDSVLDASHSWGRLAVLGAGGTRLAYDLHQTRHPMLTVVSDFNPLLMLAAQRIVRGEMVELVEFPLMPSEGEQFAIRQKMQAPAKVSDTFKFALTDATQPGFADESFDTVVTPWLIDVVQMDLADFLPVLNHLLPEGGSWINFGPLGFNNPRVGAHYSAEEVHYLLKKSGFEIRKENFTRIPYMQNPSSNSHRIERVWTVHARKVKTVEIPDQLHGELFAWEADPDAAVDIPVSELNLVAGHTFNAEVFALVDGKRSFNEIARTLENDKSLSPAHAAQILTHILSQAEQLSQRNPLRR